MAKATLGLPGQIIAWFTYLFLLYSLLAAYTAGGGDFLQHLFSLFHVNITDWMASVLFVLIFSFVVFHGIRSVDYVNRGLMTVKFGALFLFFILMLPHIDIHNILQWHLQYLTAGLTVTITSFGFANIVPSLRNYFHSDVKKLRQVIFIGSLIPLVCYILWDLSIMGIIAREGDHGLIAMLHSGNSNSEFVTALSNILRNTTITYIAGIFTTICLATSFLGVSLSLTDFLADGLKQTKSGRGAVIVYSTTFLPPLLVVLINPNIFIKALSYAGIDCIVLLVILPVAMAWFGRYIKQIPRSYQPYGGKTMLIVLLLCGIFIIGQGLL
jgi:tyrosine-specific transport protein